MKNFTIKAAFNNTLNDIEQVVFNLIMNTVSSVDDKLDKDCSDFSEKDKTLIYKSFTDQSSGFIRVSSDLLKRYAQFKHSSNSEIHSGVDLQSELNNQRWNRINRGRIYTQEEFESMVTDDFISVYDRMFLRAIYEGIDFNTNPENFLYLNEESCKQENNCIVLHDGGEVSVSAELMELLIEGARAKKYKRWGGNSNTNTRLDSIKDYILEQDVARCFKRFNIDYNMDNKQISAQIRAYFQILKRTRKDQQKFTMMNIKMSGFINAVFKHGLHDLSTSDIFYMPEIEILSQRYGIPTESRPYKVFISKFIM